MSYRTILTSVGLVAALTVLLPPSAFAQRGDRGRAVPRGSVRVARPPVYRGPSRYYYRTYRPATNFGFFYGRPGYYGSYLYGSPFFYSGFYDYSPFYYPVPGFRGVPYGYGSVPYGYGSVPYGYGYSGYSGRPYGGVRIDLPQRDAEVYVDGYFTGTVDNFDGVLQQANIEAGPHRIEIREPGFETISFDVNVEPGRTITYRASMRPLRP